MVEFFYFLTRDNWGFPYHILLSMIGTQALLLFFITYGNVKTLEGVLKRASWVFLILPLTIGYINEIIDKDSAEFWQDMIGNFVGFLIGATILTLTWYLVEKRK